MLEALAVLGGLAAGWTIVSIMLGAMRPATPHGRPIPPDADPEKDWPSLLGVSRDASDEAVRLAYERRIAELVRSAPRVMTRQEEARHSEARRMLDRALHHALPPRS